MVAFSRGCEIVIRNQIDIKHLNPKILQLCLPNPSIPFPILPQTFAGK